MSICTSGSAHGNCGGSKTSLDIPKTCQANLGITCTLQDPEPDPEELSGSGVKYIPIKYVYNNLGFRGRELVSP